MNAARNTYARQYRQKRYMDAIREMAACKKRFPLTQLMAKYRMGSNTPALRKLGWVETVSTNKGTLWTGPTPSSERELAQMADRLMRAIGGERPDPSAGEPAPLAKVHERVAPASISRYVALLRALSSENGFFPFGERVAHFGVRDCGGSMRRLGWIVTVSNKGARWVGPTMITEGILVKMAKRLIEAAADDRRKYLAKVKPVACQPPTEPLPIPKVNDHIATAERWAQRETGFHGDRTPLSSAEKDRFYTEMGRALALLKFIDEAELTETTTRA